MGFFSKFFKKKTTQVMGKDQIFSPANGTLKSLESLGDGVFSEKILGEGFVVESEDGKIYAPVGGKLVTLFPTKHAYGIETSNGLNVLVHVGIDTVNLNGEGFSTDLTQGQPINPGQLLATVDLDVVRNANLNPAIVLIVTKDSRLQPEAFDTTERTVTTNDVIVSQFKAA